ncbi:MAG: hypothetical protein Tp176DCM1853251_9 [Prokaryotic dsDNA virus sp.]|nr:MAG: hypothetical protein Tp176DCM1853251_9 [Prokaryotic dsDNA virus sp.]|tara:strand:- start:3001 stop:3360 length:360 start_codon:yes stop_codon:yes gene_type:complete
MTEAANKPKRTLWAVYSNTDLTEGRGHEYVEGLCESEATAIRVGAKGYIQGLDCPIKEIPVLEVDGKEMLMLCHVPFLRATSQDLHEQKKRDARRALVEKARAAGLSDDEIRALGGDVK